MKYLKLFENMKNDDIKHLCRECLIDLIHTGVGVVVEFNPQHIKPTDDLVITITYSKGLSFEGEFKDSVNQLISVLSSNYFELSQARYCVSEGKPGFAKVYHWYDISMDPTSGQVSGSDIVDIKYDGVFSMMRLFFHRW